MTRLTDFYNAASDIYGQGNKGTQIFNPRLKFNYQVYITSLFPNGRMEGVIFNRILSVDMPGHTIKTTTLNQYNKKRIIQTGVDYQAITLTAYDTGDAQIEQFLAAYHSYYYKGTFNAHSTSKYIDDLTSHNFSGNSGFSEAGYQAVPNKNFISEITIIRPASEEDRAGAVTRIYNPMISSVAVDTLDYSDSAPVQYRITFEYEGYETWTTAEYDNQKMNNGGSTTFDTSEVDSIIADRRAEEAAAQASILEALQREINTAQSETIELSLAQRGKSNPFTNVPVNVFDFDAEDAAFSVPIRLPEPEVNPGTSGQTFSGQTGSDRIVQATDYRIEVEGEMLARELANTEDPSKLDKRVSDETQIRDAMQQQVYVLEAQLEKMNPDTAAYRQTAQLLESNKKNLKAAQDRLDATKNRIDALNGKVPKVERAPGMPSQVWGPSYQELVDEFGENAMAGYVDPTTEATTITETFPTITQQVNMQAVRTSQEWEQLYVQGKTYGIPDSAIVQWADAQYNIKVNSGEITPPLTTVVNGVPQQTIVSAVQTTPATPTEVAPTATTGSTMASTRPVAEYEVKKFDEWGTEIGTEFVYLNAEEAYAAKTNRTLVKATTLNVSNKLYTQLQLDRAWQKANQSE